jgi:NADPH:quinone reductase-like Zn-dependent oxidoreductase
VLTYVTAYQMLHRVAKVKPGARILIHGASGAVGTALLQLGALQGLEMYGTVSAANRGLVSGLGAAPIDYETEDFVACIENLNPKGVDVVFDAVGGSHFQRSFRCLRKGGMVVAYGSYNSAIGKEGGGMLGFAGLLVRAALARGKSAAIYSIAPLKEKHPGWFREDLSELFRLLAQGKIRPVILQRMPLTEAAEAHRLLEKRGVKGKIVLLT